MPSGKSSALVTGQLTTSATAQSLVSQNLARINLIVVNENGTNSAWVGFSTTLTATTGMKIAPSTTVYFDNYTGPLYAIATTGTTTGVLSYSEY